MREYDARGGAFTPHRLGLAKGRFAVWHGKT
jgi:hypothetical protein